MRREREGSYNTYLPTGRHGWFSNQDFYKARRLSQTLHNNRCSLSVIQRSRNGVPIISGRYIPSLSELKYIKEAKIRRIKSLIRSGIYDTSQRQIETARRIADIFLAEKDGEN